jgi:branched-chain amino acid transport system permease protein
MLAMYTAFFIYTTFKMDIFVLLLLVSVLFFILGVPIYLGIFKKLVGRPHDWHIIYTASLGLALQNIALALWTSDPRQIYTTYRQESINLGTILLNEALLIAFGFSIIATALLFLFLYRTERGTLIRATRSNRNLVSLLGLNPQRIYLEAFCIGLALTAFGGVLLGIYYPVSPTIGGGYNIFMWVAIVLGGAGSIVGCLIGGLIIGVTQTLSALYLPLNFQNVIVLSLFVIMLVFKPKGLFGK